MTLITSNGTGGGLWSAGTSWGGGVAPIDDDGVTIAAGDTITMDTDTFGYTLGISGVTITGVAAGTPGKLEFKNGYDGFLKIRVSTDIKGTDHEVHGQIVANSDGALSTTTGLQASNSGVIFFTGASSSNGKLDCTHLDINMVCVEPAITHVQTYGTEYGPVTQSTAVDIANDRIDWGEAPPSANTAVKVRSTGTLPSGLNEHCFYYVYNITDTNKCQFARVSDYPATVVNITHVGTGDISMYTGHTNTSTKTVNVIQDVTADPDWISTSKVMMIDVGGFGADKQGDRLASTTSSGVTFTNWNVNSSQYPFGEIWLCDRNVAVRTDTNNSSQRIIEGAGSDCTFACELTNLYNFDTSASTYKGYLFSNASGVTIDGPAAGFYILFRNGQDCTLDTNGVALGTGYAGYYANNITIKGGLGGGSTGMYGCNVVHYTSTSWCRGQARAGSSYCRDIIMDGIVIGGNHCFTEGSSHTLNGEVYSTFWGTQFCSQLNFNTGAKIEGCYVGIQTGDGVKINGTIAGCIQGVYADNIGNYSAGAYNGVYTGYGGKIEYCDRAIEEIVSADFEKLTIENCAADVTIYLYEEVYGMNGNPRQRISVKNFNGDGYLGVWNGGGKTISEDYSAGTHGTPPITPPTCVHYTLTENVADTPSHVKHFIELPVSVTKDGNTEVNVYAKQIATGFDEIATFELVDSSDNVLDTWTLTDNTDWQSVTLDSGTFTYDGSVFLRMTTRGQNKELYWFQTISTGAAAPPAATETVGFLVVEQHP